MDIVRDGAMMPTCRRSRRLEAHRLTPEAHRLARALRIVRSPRVADLPLPPPGRSGWPWSEGSVPVAETLPDRVYGLE